MSLGSNRHRPCDLLCYGATALFINKKKIVRTYFEKKDYVNILRGFYASACPFSMYSKQQLKYSTLVTCNNIFDKSAAYCAAPLTKTTGVLVT